MNKEITDKQRLIDLLAIVQKISAGDLTAYAQKGKDDVIGMLAVGINMMIDDMKNGSVLRTINEQLKGLNQQLRASEQQLKAVNQQLKAERNKLQAVVDAMEYGLTIQDRDYNITFQNKILEGMFGGLGEKCYKAYEKRVKRCDGCPVEKSFRDGISYTTERKVTMPTGEIAYWENTANPIRNAAGEIVSCLEIARNITKNKHAEETIKAVNQQLRASEQQLKAANQQLKAKEQALLSKMSDLERFNKLMVGRELDMIVLKKEVNCLLEKAGQPNKYEVA